MKPTSETIKENRTLETKVATQTTPALWHSVIVGVFILTLVSALLGLLFSSGDKTTAFVSVMVAMAGALLVVMALPRIVSFAFGPVKATLDRIEEGQKLLKSDIEAIRVALKGSVTKYEHEYLKRLSNPRPFPSEVGDGEYHYEDDKHHYSHDVYPRLKRLDDLGFIRPTEIDGHRSLIRIKEDHADDEREPFTEKRPRFKLRDYVEITAAGTKYLELAGSEY